jgi:rRNA maturation endonuclease Nob1
MAKRGPELRYAIASVLVFVFLGAGFVWGAPTLLSAKDAFVEDLAVFSEEASKGISKFSQDVSQISDINLSRVIDKNFPSTRTGARGVVQNFRDGKDFVVDGFSRAGQEILRFAQNDKGWDFRNDGYGLIDSAKYGLGYTREMLGEYTQWLNQTFVKPPSRAVAKNISIATASLTSDGESFYGKYLAANNWVEDKIEKLATIPEKLSNIFFGADETDLAEQEQEPEQEPEQEIEEAAKEFAETGDMEKLQQRIKELEARGYQQKEIIKEVKKITQIQPVQKITKQTNVIDSQALITLASLEDRIDDIEEWEKDIRTLQSITKKLQANPPTTAASTAPIYIGSQGIQVGGARLRLAAMLTRQPDWILPAATSQSAIQTLLLIISPATL